MSDAELNAVVGPIYVELFRLRDKIAKSYGYDNYADFADQEIYLRDYGTEEAEIFHEAVKTVSESYYSALTKFY